MYRWDEYVALDCERLRVQAARLLAVAEKIEEGTARERAERTAAMLFRIADEVEAEGDVEESR